MISQYEAGATWAYVPPTVRRDVIAVGTQVAVMLEFVLVGGIHVVRVTVVTVGGAVVTI